MILAALAYLGGVLTILSPCILPVIPFVFAQSDQPFRRSGLPLLIGMALTFVVLSSVATLGGAWIVAANQYGRLAALILMTGFGLTLLSERLATIVSRPVVALGEKLANRQSDNGGEGRGGIGRAVLLGVATGLLWTPCAGPILGLILTGAAIQHDTLGSAALLLAYAAGAATALAIVLKAGSKISRSFKHVLGAEFWLRRVLGVAVLAGVAAIAFGLDRTVLTRLTPVDTAGLEQNLLDHYAPVPTSSVPTTAAQRVGQGEKNGAMAMTGGAMTGNTMMQGTAGAMMSASKTPAMTNAMNAQPTAMMSAATGTAAATEAAPSLLDFTGAVSWLNSPPLTAAELKGKVVLVDFWTYSCVNCLRSLPYVRAWATQYKDKGLVVVGVHSPEFAFERDESNVRQAAADLGVSYPVALDNGYAIWKAFGNQYWPAHYLFDASGRLRYHHFGEGKYAQTEMAIQGLLAEAAGQKQPAIASTAAPSLDGSAMAADDNDLRSLETYIGYARSDRFAAQAGDGADPIIRDAVGSYTVRPELALNDWGLAGQWQIGPEQAQATAAGSRITYKFHARDLNLVLGPGMDGKPVAFRVLIDGKAPAAAHGGDIDADGKGVVTGHRLYQLIRQADGAARDHVFEIEFQDPGIQAYAFTFG